MNEVQRQPRGTLVRDPELAVLGKVIEMFANLAPHQRRRVLDYVNGRLEDLPPPDGHDPFILPLIARPVEEDDAQAA